MRWLLPEASEDTAVSLAEALRLHPLPARVLVHRGYTTPRGRPAFLSDRLADLPDPFTMKGMPAAVERLLPRPAREGEDHPLRRLRRGRRVLHRRCSPCSWRSWAPQVGHVHPAPAGRGLRPQPPGDGADRRGRHPAAGDAGLRHHLRTRRSPGPTGWAWTWWWWITTRCRRRCRRRWRCSTRTSPAASTPPRHLCAAGVAFNLCMGLRKRLRDEGFFATPQGAQPQGADGPGGAGHGGGRGAAHRGQPHPREARACRS